MGGLFAQRQSCLVGSLQYARMTALCHFALSQQLPIPVALNSSVLYKSLAIALGASSLGKKLLS